jgi:hypothetical protein
MYEFRDPTRLTHLAIGVLAVYLALSVAVSAVALAAILGAPPETLMAGFGGDVAAALAGFVILFVIACYVIVGRWIYVTNANAHALSAWMTITPGWAVGWFFVPFANLFKPYQAMKETWQASHFGEASDDTSLLVAWWVLWIASNFVGSASTRLDTPDRLTLFDVAGGAINVALTVVLITLMRRLAAAQLNARRWEVFA